MLYLTLCMACHGPSTFGTTFAPEWWTEGKSTYGKHFRIKRIVDADYIGTDQRAARNSNSKGEGAAGADTSTDDATALILKSVVQQNVKKPDTDALATPSESVLQFGAFAKFKIRSPLGYAAVPLDGVWAMAPYLHNGAIPSVYGCSPSVPPQLSTRACGPRKLMKTTSSRIQNRRGSERRD
jgi:hypothetical protein